MVRRFDHFCWVGTSPGELGDGRWYRLNFLENAVRVIHFSIYLFFSMLHDFDAAMVFGVDFVFSGIYPLYIFSAYSEISLQPCTSTIRLDYSISMRSCSCSSLPDLAVGNSGFQSQGRSFSDGIAIIKEQENISHHLTEPSESHLVVRFLSKNKTQSNYPAYAVLPRPLCSCLCMCLYFVLAS